MADDTDQLIRLTADIVAAHVGHNHVRVADVPELIRSVHGALAAATAPAVEAPPAKPVGAVSVRASVKPDRLISMIDGKPYKALARHLARHGYTPATYREAFDLPRDYPMVAADFAEKRRSLALEHRFGRKRDEGPSEPELAAEEVEQGDTEAMAADGVVADRDDTPASAPELPLDAEPAEMEQAPDAAAESTPKARRSRLKLRMSGYPDRLEQRHGALIQLAACLPPHRFWRCRWRQPNTSLCEPRRASRSVAASGLP